MTNLIVVSAESELPGEAGLVKQLIDEGLRLFHIRKPLWTIERQREFLRALGPDYTKFCSVHQHHGTGEEFDLQYTHYPEKIRPTNFARVNGIRYSTSFHDGETQALLSGNFDYCFCGPFSKSISKPDYGNGKTPIVPLPVNRTFAIGGITDKNAMDALSQGYYGVAALGFIWSDPAATINNFKKINTQCSLNVNMR